MSDTKQELLHGIFWSAIEKYSSLIIGVVVSMILARLLSPEDYGIVAVATVIIHFFQLFCSMGIAPAIIQKKELDKNDLNNIFSFTVYIGTFLSGLFFILSFLIADIYNSQKLATICQLLSIQIFFSAANMVPNALMLRDKRFRQLAQRTLLLVITSGILSIFAAFYGLGVYSLLISPIITVIGIFIWNRFFYPVVFIPFFSFISIKKIYSYSSYQFLFEFVNYFSRNLDKLLIGKFVSFGDLGFYEKSYRLMQLPLNNLTSVINPVMQPVLSIYEKDYKGICRKYEKIIHSIALISFPLGGLLFVCSEEIITLLYGSQWLLAIPTFKILTFSIPLQLILSTTGAIYQSCNATKNLFFVGLRNSFLTIVGFFIALFFGGTIESVAWGWTLTSFACFISSYWELYDRIFHVSLMSLVKQLVFPLISLISTVLVTLFIDYIDGLNYFILLVVKIGVVLLLQLVLIQMFEFDIFSYIKNKVYVYKL